MNPTNWKKSFDFSSDQHLFMWFQNPHIVRIENVLLLLLFIGAATSDDKCLNDCSGNGLCTEGRCYCELLFEGKVHFLYLFKLDKNEHLLLGLFHILERYSTLVRCLHWTLHMGNSPSNHNHRLLFIPIYSQLESCNHCKFHLSSSSFIHSFVFRTESLNLPLFHGFLLDPQQEVYVCFIFSIHSEFSQMQ